MKQTFLIAFYAILTITLACSKDDEVNVDGTSYVVGFDPCTIHHGYPIGYILISEDLRDTVVAYNLSDRQFTLPASVVLTPNDPLYTIPEAYFKNYQSTPYFPDSLRFRYGLTANYRLAREGEKIYNLCTSDVLSLNLDQVIIETASKK